MYLYAKDPCETKYQSLINKREIVGLKHCNDSGAFIEYSITCKIFIKKLKNTIQEKNLLIVFVYMIADMISNEKLNPIVTELFIRGRKLNI